MRAWFAMVPLVLAGCASAPKTSSFDVPADRDTVIDEVQQAIVAEGFDIGELNDRVGFVRTDWTNIPVGNVTGATHRRYTVLLKEVGGQTRVTVRGEFQRCEMTGPAGTVTTEQTCTRVDWQTRTCISQETRPEVICSTLATIMGDDQQDLDAFAAKVRESLGVEAPPPAP